MDKIEALADYLTQCRATPMKIEVAEHERLQSLGAGYDVQERRHDALGADGIGGYKIGCTTAVMQRFLGIDHPCVGRVRQEDVHRTGLRVESQRLVRGAVECEIAVRMKDAPLGTDAQSVSDAISTVMPSIEIVDDRYDDYATLGAATLIADDFFQTALVLGEERPWDGSIDLNAVRGTMTVNERVHGSGQGTDILGAPINALVWLVNHLQQRGRSLVAGDVVSLGSVVETWWASPGDLIRVQFDSLGEVTCSFA